MVHRSGRPGEDTMVDALSRPSPKPKVKQFKYYMNVEEGV